MPDALNSSTATWIRYFRVNPGSQMRAFEALLETTREIDAKHGTNVAGDLWINFLKGFYEKIP
jgi:hypothetical protein